MKRICNIFNIPSHYRKKIYQMIDREFDCKFVFGDDDLKVKTFDIAGLRNAEIAHVSSIGKLQFQNGILKTVFQDFDAYIIGASTNNVSHWVFLLLLKLFPSKKVYFWTHGLYGNESKKQLLMRKMNYALADGLFVYGDYSIDLIKKKGYKKDNELFLIHNSLDYDMQLELRNNIETTSIYHDHFGNNYSTIIFIGRLTKVKKLDLLVDALALLKERGENYNLVFVGDGVESENLKKKVEGLHLSDNVWFYGACYDEARNSELVYNADLCVAPGNIGLTAMHVLMFGCPAISHSDFKWQMPEFEAIKPGITGDFFEKDNVESLANTISKWFADKCEIREEVRRSCFEEIDTRWTPYYQMEIIKKALQ